MIIIVLLNIHFNCTSSPDCFFTIVRLGDNTTAKNAVIPDNIAPFTFLNKNDNVRYNTINTTKNIIIENPMALVFALIFNRRLLQLFLLQKHQNKNLDQQVQNQH